MNLSWQFHDWNASIIVFHPVNTQFEKCEVGVEECFNIQHFSLRVRQKVTIIFFQCPVNSADRKGEERTNMATAHFPGERGRGRRSKRGGREHRKKIPGYFIIQRQQIHQCDLTFWTSFWRPELQNDRQTWMIWRGDKGRMKRGTMEIKWGKIRFMFILLPLLHAVVRVWRAVSNLRCPLFFP